MVCFVISEVMEASQSHIAKMECRRLSITREED